MALLKKGEKPNLMLKAHYSYQARAFAYSVLWLIPGMFTAVLLVAYLD